MDKQTIYQQGLSNNEVQTRIDQGQINHAQDSMTKSVSQIFKENILTLFNLLNFIIAIALALVGAWSNLIFIAIIVLNVIIGIAQELHAKKLVDALSLLMVPHVVVKRNGKELEISVNELVMDDIMVLSSGQQICCDSNIVQGEVEVNESLLTGESDPLHKGIGDSLLSGSSIIAGKCYAQVVHIGEDNYVTKIANEVKQIREVQSELMTSMRRVTKITCAMIVPLGLILFFEAMYLQDQTLKNSIISSSAGLLGMLPKGLVLLISVSLATGVSKLAKQKILIQDLYSLEALAHIDTLCLDKTGTITNGNLEVIKIKELQEGARANIQDYIQSFLFHCDDNNATFEALCTYFGKKDTHTPSHKIPFSSLYKWSASQFDDFGTLVIGAPDKLMNQLPHDLQELMMEGKRILIIGKTKEAITNTNDLPSIEPLLAIILSDSIRHRVSETLTYFKKEGIDIKIISGDHISTVSAIAREAGLAQWQSCIDMSTLTQDITMDEIVANYAVFGRVTPKQKKELVEALQRNGHKVAMTGDGVNDMLALKEADCSIAIAEGSDAVKQMSQVVLLNSDFACLPDVLLEGRRVVNNVTRVAGVFFIKTIYSILLSIVCALFNFPFPFIPIQITLIDMVIEAFPAFVTMLEPNTKPIQGVFLKNVFRNALPNAIAVFLCIITVQVLSDPLAISAQQANTMMYLSLATISIFAVIRSCHPFTTLRIAVCIVMIISFLVAITLFHTILHVSPITLSQFIMTTIIALLGLLLRMIISKLYKQ